MDRSLNIKAKLDTENEALHRIQYLPKRGLIMGFSYCALFAYDDKTHEKRLKKEIYLSTYTANQTETYILAVVPATNENKNILLYMKFMQTSDKKLELEDQVEMFRKKSPGMFVIYPMESKN